ncbi:hypothetical protein PC116_g22195 [Phytophthora cactorum]|nr:hypothetical protein PC116_g22195 [Phytophthora cactorum]
MIRTAGKDDSRATVDQTADGVSPLRARMWTARKKEGRRCGRRLRRKAKPITTPDLERPRYSRCPSSSLLWRFQVVRQLLPSVCRSWTTLRRPVESS